jgi:signal transduction histidine kinase
VENSPLLALWAFLLLRPVRIFNLTEVLPYRREAGLVLSLLLFQPVFFLFLLNFSLAEKTPLSQVLTVGIPSVLLWVVALALPAANILLLRRLDRLYREALELGRREKLILLGEAAAALAHEIRNPVQLFRGVIEFLRSLVPEEGVLKEVRGELGRAYELTFFLEKLADEFLSLSRTKKKEEEIELSALLQKVVEESHPVAEPLGVAVQLELHPGLPRVRGDEARLRLAIRNLVENGAQSEPRDRRVLVEVQPAEGGVVIRVRDRGRGIPAEHQEHVFRPFFTTKEEGTGLGLAIVKQVVEEHGGRVELESTPGEGTVFSVFLPREE